MNAKRMATRAGLAAAAIVLGGLADAHAQNPPAPAAPQPPAIVTGQFVDSAGVPIRHAVLSVVGESLRVVADSQGRFRLLVPPGPKLLAARALGYRPLMWSVTLVSGQEATGQVRLQQLSFVLPEITVTAERPAPSRLAGFYQRKQTGLGRYITPEMIAQRFTNSMADLLQQIPGVRVRPVPGDPFNNLVAFSRCNLGPTGTIIERPTATNVRGVGQPTSPATTGPAAKSAVGVYVDGFRVPGAAGQILAMINPADVEAIEVYRGPSELPAEFMSDDCAAIVIWTKY